MANDWRDTTLGDVCQLRAGSVFPPALQGKSVGSYPFVKVSDMNLAANVVRIQDANNWIDDEDLRQLKAKPFPPGTTVFAKIGEALKANRLRYIIRPTIIDNNMMGAIPASDAVDSRFFHYALSQFDFGAVAGGTALPYLTVGALSKLEIAIPPLPEQRAIAHILGTLDDKIENLRRQNESLEAMSRALFKAWFIDFEPVRAKLEGRWLHGQSLPGLPAHIYDIFPDRLVESELGEIPAGWWALPLYDIATYVNGAALKAFRPNDDRRGLPIIKIAELKAGVTAQTKFSDVAMPEKYRLRTGDILFSWSGNPDTSIDTFIWAHGDAWLNQHIFRVDVHSPSERAFVVATLKYLRPVFAEIARNKQTTGLGHVTVGDMQRLLVVKPEEQALAAWDRVAAPIFAAAFRNEADSISLGLLRDTLLTKLISGELRVADAERLLGEVKKA